jgi:ATP-binding cassette, subfamily B, bacterial
MQKEAKLTQNPYFSLLRIAWKYAREEQRKYIGIYVLFMFSNIAMALYPIIWGMYVNEIQKSGANVLRSSVMYGLAYLLVRFIDWAFHGPARLIERELAFNLSRNFLQEIYHKALHLPVSWHQDNHSGETINRVKKAYEALRDFFQNGFEYLHTFFKFIFSFAAMIYFAPSFGILAVFLGFFVVWIILKFDTPFIATQNEINDRESVVTSTLFDSLSNIVTVITLRLEKRVETGLLAKIAYILPPFKKNISLNEWKWFVTDMLVGVIYAVILVGYVWQNWTPGTVFQLGGLVMLVGYVERFTSVFHNVAYLYTDVVKHHTDVTMAFKILDAYDEHHLPDVEKQLPKDWQTIDIQGLNFSYQSTNHASTETEVNVSTEVERSRNLSDRSINQSRFDYAQRPTNQLNLNNVNLHLERGKRIALIGESGSGKSTVLALLRGLYPPQNGVKVLINQHQEENLDIIAEAVTLFPQEPEIFENTLEYNITLGLPFEKGDIEKICQSVHFQEVIDQLPKGLQSNIMEKGVNLSGGQKQRLALARGVFAAAESHIILLDEPTSSVDPKTEAKIYDGLFEAFSDKVVVSSLHRLHLLTKFDYIYVFDKGCIAAEGTLEELLENSLIFKELWKHQEEILGL